MGYKLEVIVPIHNISERRDSLSKLLSMDARIDTRFIIVSDSRVDGDHSEVKRIVNASQNWNSKVVTGSFGSPGMARNAGLSVTDARWISFLDSDDEIDLDAVSKLISNTEKKSANLGIGGIVFHSQENHTRLKYFMNHSLPVLTNLSLTPAFTRMVFHKSLLSQVFFPEFLMAEDQCFLIDILIRNPRIHSEDIYFYTYNLGGIGQSIRSRKALSDIPLSVAYIASQMNKYSPDVQHAAITMIVRQSATFLRSVGLNPSKRLFNLFRLLTMILVRYPVKTGRSVALVLIHRPRSFA